MYDVQFDLDDEQRKIAESTALITSVVTDHPPSSAVYDQRIR